MEAPRLAGATDGFTGADLKHVVEDGKTFYAGANARRQELQPPLHYFLEAVASVRKNKQFYAEAEQAATNHARGTAGP